MLIEGTSQYLLKKVRAKAKMYEYHIPLELHGEIEKEVPYLLILAIATIGDFSNDIIDSFRGIECDYQEHKKNLRFSSKFFEAYLDSNLYYGDKDYYLLLGSVVYYLCDYNGSSQVLASRISDDIDMGINQIDRVLLQILEGEKRIRCSYESGLIRKIADDYNNFLCTGEFSGAENLYRLKTTIYEIGSDRAVLFSDALIATIFTKVSNSTYKLMPEYTNINVDIWKEAISKGTLITELWQSQRELGVSGVFNGQSATIQMPTSSGKTKSVALIILSAFMSMRTNYAIVVAPYRSLCREISTELEKTFSFNENIHVNELSDVIQMDFLDSLFENNHQSKEKYVYIVTPEKLLFVFRQNITILANVGLIIFDEGHLFDDLSRGITYELLVSSIKFYIGDMTQKILISAVIPNAIEINEWLTHKKGVVIKNNVIQTTEKTVAIVDTKVNRESKKNYAYLYFVNPDNPEEEEYFVPRVISQVKISKLGKERNDRIFPEINNGKNKNKNDMALAFAIKLCTNGGVAIFCGKKQTADKLLERVLDIYTRGYDLTKIKESSDQAEISKLCNLIEKHLGKASLYYKAATVGAFIHHSGIPMGIRCSVEYAMQLDKIHFLACTSTLAQGVNLPIRYLIIPSIYQGKERIKVRDFQNLIGRAGRAGIYTEGTIVLTETNVYAKRNNPYNNWKWENYKQLLNSNQAEACTSELLAWMRVDDDMEEYLEGIISIFEQTYEAGNFVLKINDFLDEIKDKKEEVYFKAEFIVFKMLNNIVAIESFLLFYLMDDTYEKSKETIHAIIQETLAYYLGNDNERLRLFRIVDLIGEFLVKTVDSPDKRNRYSKSLLGVRKVIEIEEWVNVHISEIESSTNDEDILKTIFPLLISTNNYIAKTCNKPEILSDIGVQWINGVSYVNIKKYCDGVGFRITKKGKGNIISLGQIIDFCENFLGYDCTLTLAAIIENLQVVCENMDLINKFRILSKRLRYGVTKQSSIILYEMGFNDRVIAEHIAGLIDHEYEAGSKKEIIRRVKNNEVIYDSIMEYITEYPTYFYDRAMSYFNI